MSADLLHGAPEPAGSADAHGDVAPRATLRVCVAGATGWTGRAVALAVVAAPDLQLVAAVSRTAAGRDLGEAWGGTAIGVPVHGTVAEALDSEDARVDVVVDYTSPLAVEANVFAALDRRTAVVVGSSGLGAEEYERIDQRARDNGAGVVAAGNFSVTAAMAQAAAVLVAPFLPDYEVIDFAAAGKPDAPSGTARELAEKLAVARQAAGTEAAGDGPAQPPARGATIAGTQVHSIRLPGFVVSTEVVFALADERLTIRHDAGPTPAPYVDGTLMAIRAVVRRTGLVRGLDTLLLGGTGVSPPS